MAPDVGLSTMFHLNKTRIGHAELIEDGWHLDVVNSEDARTLHQSFVRKHGWIERHYTQLLLWAVE
jgi:hypothetical protein